MSKAYENLNGIFEIEPTLHAEVVDETDPETEIQKFGKEIVSLSAKERDLENDYETVRSNMNALIVKGQTLLSGAMELAEDSESPRAYEVAINGIKSISEVTEKLLQLHEKIAKIESDKQSSASSPIHATQNNIFVNTTTAELIKSLKESTAKENINKKEKAEK
jgi:hypothetical protein